MKKNRSRLTRWTGAAVALLLALAAGPVWAFWPVRLAPTSVPADLALPPASPPASLTLRALPTGHTRSRAMFAYRGGDLGDERTFAMTAYLVEHPRGRLLIDAGLGSEGRAHYAELPALMRATTMLEASVPAAEQLRRAGLGLTAVLLTHAHWDHVSGMSDMPEVPVWLPEEEADYVEAGTDGAELAHAMRGLRVERYRFSSGPYLGYAESHDVWGDGSVVVVPAPGHTPGSVIVFVVLPDARRFVFVGDLVWQREGLSLPAERPLPSRMLVDSDPAEVRAQIRHLAALARRFPELIVVPAHDARPTADLPRL